jgi:hypothetical protein
LVNSNEEKYKEPPIFNPSSEIKMHRIFGAGHVDKNMLTISREYNSSNSYSYIHNNNAETWMPYGGQLKTSA